MEKGGICFGYSPPEVSLLGEVGLGGREVAHGKTDLFSQGLLQLLHTVAVGWPFSVSIRAAASDLL